MKRNNELIEQPIYDANEEPIVFSKPLMDLFLTRARPGDLIALYSFYYYTAKWQGTNQPKATDVYCQKGLKWGYAKFNTAKKELLKLGLIKLIRGRDKDQGFITGWYIKVQFIWKKETVANITKHKNPCSNVVVKTQEPYFTSSCDRSINALSTNNKNALSTITPAQKKYKLYRPLARKLAVIIQSKKNIVLTGHQIKAWVKPIQALIEINQVSFSRVETALDWYKKHSTDPYVPVIESGNSLKEKFIKLENAIERQKNPPINNTPKANTVGFKEVGKVYRGPDRIV